MSFCLTKITSFSPSLCYSVFKKTSVSFRHSVILSSKNICLPLSLCHYVFKKTSVSLCHYVIMSSKKNLSPFVIMSLCLQKTSVYLCHYVIMSSKKICLPLSLCHYVFKKHLSPSPSLCYSVFKKNLSTFVILSSKKHLSLSVTLLFCLQKTSVYLCHYVFKKISVSLSVPLLFCLKTPQLGTEADPAVVVVISFLSVLYQYFISCATSSPTTFLQYILFYKVVEITSCGILRTVSYLVPLRGSQLSFKTIEEHVKHLSLSVV